ncbi:hypothetical protein [Ignatzschineria cameli]|uniref:Uncharacterized protein n=1 Tax=Ignatzschineria cameli TaxID=2182793 RepID=A0A2U2AQB7_9GAMM|nr:hypothetical protein [Ignatzschineria cameli]PWD85822.1 hypothetical protein DC077_07255 [Ignatzschineria cameli]PWD89450.1 hypothetical protein DC079_06880 [Ignatzschineria cameli]PWD90922.1 hypothetical protein DC081_06590 [Ignatzschineria cameli]PWD91710.1 hypothetical protein DC078_06875 [Ignatzschineria cameli]
MEVNYKERYEILINLRKSFDVIIKKIEADDYTNFLNGISKYMEVKDPDAFIKEIVVSTRWILQVLFAEADKSKSWISSYSEHGVIKLIGKLTILLNLIENLSKFEFVLGEDKKNVMNNYRRTNLLDLMTNILNYIQSIKFDMLFSDNFTLQINAPKDFRRTMQAIEEIHSDSKKIELQKQEAEKLLSDMKLIADAATREGLTKSFKLSVDSLTKKIRWLDIINYVSLVAMGIMSYFIFDSVIGDESLKMYGRFLMITPLIFLSWFVSKRSQFLYQIKEEYSYKYATALAYEGYKEEIEKYWDSRDGNSKMRDRLMEMTIDNLARSPLEQFDKNLDHAPYVQILKELRK